MSSTDEKRRTILNAATTQFSQYGFRKTSMEDIAREAGISRPSLYSYFENKEDVFRGVSQQLSEDAFRDAEDALTGNRGKLFVGQRVEAALKDFSVRLYRRLHESNHGEELMDENNRLCGDIAQKTYADFEAILAAELEYAMREEYLDLSSAEVTAKEAAEIIRYGAIGLKTGAKDVNHYQKRVERFIRVYFAGLEAPVEA
ncbi:MAG: TetR/AcrR family transcriptional regulator [Pseudomonadales bacterium]|nr:TetR/AcrR family transcriptional regulator [Pseudomonadales bacterium]